MMSTTHMDSVKFLQHMHNQLSIIGEDISLKEEYYYCPICQKEVLKDNFKIVLSKEHVPQEKLGGKIRLLTCRQCNSKCGHNIDGDLINYIISLEQNDFLPQTDRNVFICNGEQRLNAKLKINSHSDIQLQVPIKNNNPKLITEYQQNILLPNEIINIKNKNLKINDRKVSSAIIKNAYLLLFARTGYTFLFDSFYNVLRKQILDPEPYYLPERLWTILPQNMFLPNDIYITTDNRMRGFFVVYTLKIRTIHKVCVLIPTPKVEYLSAAYELRKIQHGSILPLWSPPKNMDFINNQQDIERLRNWCYGWNKII